MQVPKDTSIHIKPSKKYMTYNLKKELPSILLVLISWALGWYFYSHFPAQVVTHWNFYGEPDAWGKGSVNALVFPGILTGMYLLFFMLPKFDPKKDRYPEFEKVYTRLSYDSGLFS